MPEDFATHQPKLSIDFRKRLAYAFLCLMGVLRTVVLILEKPNALSVYNLGIDTKAFKDLALSFLSHGFEAIPPTHPPGFIIYLSGFYKFFSSPELVIKLVNVFWIAVISAATYQVMKKLFSSSIALLCILCILYSPTLRAYAATIQYEVVVTALLWMSIALLIDFPNSVSMAERTMRIIASALCLSIATLFREPLFVAIVPFIFYIFISRKRGEPWLRNSFLFSLFFALPIAFWMAHQYRALGEIIPISKKSEINFLIGNNNLSNGTFNVVRTGIGEQNGFAFIKNNPGVAAKLLFKKIGFLLGITRDGWNVPSEGSLLWWKFLYGLVPFEWCMFLSQISLPLLSLIGCIIASKIKAYRKGAFFLLLLCLAYGAAFVPFFGSFRFFIPMLPLCYGFSSVAFFSAIRGASFKTVGISVLLALILLLAASKVRVSLPFHLTLAPHELDGVSVAEVSNGNQELLFIEQKDTPRLGAFFPHEYFPRGTYTVTVSYKSDGPNDSNVGKLSLRGAYNNALCEQELLPSVSLQTFSMDCEIQKMQPVSILFRTQKNSGSVWLSAITVDRRS